ncbi:MAG: MaoC/PaaZ C-terminal domain-containing protein [Desulfatibacillaceae bacterium]
MTVSPLYIRHQTAVIGALIKTAANGGKGKSWKKPAQPPPPVTATLPPRPRDLVADYIRHVGGDPSWYKGTLPPHLFPQWGFPLLAKTLAGQPYDLTKVLNGGATFKVNRPIPLDRPLVCTARLAGVDEDDSKVLFRQALTTGTPEDHNMLECEVQALLPKRGGKKKGGDREKPHVPQGAREVGNMKLSSGVGLDFALLTGDFNPIHWIPPLARMSGFSNNINHGFSTMARTIEILNRNMLAGRPYRLRGFSCRFTRPLVLPGTAYVFTADKNTLYTAPARTTQPYLLGEYELA